MSTTVAPGYTIHVAGLAPETTEDKLHDFFSFCGKLVSVNKTGTSADITFEKLSAMRTSLMLNGGTLDGAHLEVTSASDVEPKASVLPTGASGSTPIGAGLTGSSDISQEDKPRAAIVAEYLAHGYVLGDHVIQRAIDFDQKQGISNKFLDFFHSLDKNVGAKVVGEDKTVSSKLNEHAAAVVAKTREVDQNRGVSAKFSEYYNRLSGTGFGQKVHHFYTTTQKQVLDVHEEARRLAVSRISRPLRIADGQDEKKAAAGTATPTSASTPAPTATTTEPGATLDAKAPVPVAPVAVP